MWNDGLNPFAVLAAVVVAGPGASDDEVAEHTRRIRRLLAIDAARIPPPTPAPIPAPISTVPLDPDRPVLDDAFARRSRRRRLAAMAVLAAAITILTILGGVLAAAIATNRRVLTWEPAAAVHAGDPAPARRSVGEQLRGRDPALLEVGHDPGLLVAAALQIREAAARIRVVDSGELHVELREP